LGFGAGTPCNPNLVPPRRAEYRRDSEKDQHQRL